MASKEEYRIRLCRIVKNKVIDFITNLKTVFR